MYLLIYNPNVPILNKIIWTKVTLIHSKQSERVCGKSFFCQSEERTDNEEPDDILKLYVIKILLKYFTKILCYKNISKVLKFAVNLYLRHSFFFCILLEYYFGI